MYVNIHAADEYAESPGRNTKAWSDGDVTFKHVMLQNGEPGIEMRFACTEAFGTGGRSYVTEPKSIRRTVSIWLDPSDVSTLVALLARWPRSVTQDDDALALIQKLAGDVRKGRQ